MATPLLSGREYGNPAPIKVKKTNQQFTTENIMQFTAEEMMRHAPYVMKQNRWFGNKDLCRAFAYRTAELLYQGNSRLKNHSNPNLLKNSLALCVEYKSDFANGLKPFIKHDKKFLAECQDNLLIRTVLNEPRGIPARAWRFVKKWTGISALQRLLGVDSTVKADGQWRVLQKALDNSPRKKSSTTSLNPLHKLSNTSTNNVPTIVPEILKKITTVTDIEVLQLTNEPIKLKWLTRHYQMMQNAPPVFVKRFNAAKKRVGQALATLIALSSQQERVIHNHAMHPLKSALKVDITAFNFGKSQGLIAREGDTMVWTTKGRDLGFANYPSQETNLYTHYIGNLHDALYTTAFPKIPLYEASLTLLNDTSSCLYLSVILDDNAMKGDDFSSVFFQIKEVNKSKSEHRYQALIRAAKLKAFYHAIKTKTVSIQEDGRLRFNSKAVVSAILVNLRDQFYKIGQDASVLKSGAEDALKQSIKSLLTSLGIEKNNAEKLDKLSEFLSKKTLIIVREKNDHPRFKQQDIIDLLANKLTWYQNTFRPIAAQQIANELSTLLSESEAQLLFNTVPDLQSLPYNSSTGRLSTTLGIPNDLLNRRNQNSQEQDKELLLNLLSGSDEWIQRNAKTADLPPQRQSLNDNDLMNINHSNTGGSMSSVKL